MPGREQIPSYHLATGTTDQIDYCYNITPGCIVYNTDTSDVVIYGEDLEITGNFMIKDISVNNMEISGNLNLEYNIFDTSVLALAGGTGGLTGTGGVQGIASSNSDYDVSNSPIKAFNGTLVDNDDCWESLDNLPAYPKSLIFEFPYDVIVTKYKIWPRFDTNGPGEAPETWTLQAYPAGPRDRMYPPTRNLTSASHTISGQAYGNGVYITSESSVYTGSGGPFTGHTAFNTSNIHGYHGLPNTYSCLLYTSDAADE